MSIKRYTFIPGAGMSLYPNIGEYGLSTDEESIIEEEEEYISSPRGPSMLSPGQLSKHMRPLSKYDHRPRNVEFDGRKFISSRRRQGAKVNFEEDVTVSLSNVEFAEDKVCRGHQIRGRSRGEWLGPNEVWRMDMCRVVALGCLLGLLLGIGYRGDFSGLYLGLFHRDNLLKCPSDSFDQPCLGPSQIQLALLHLEPLKAQLHTKAGQFECEDKGAYSKGMTIQELRKGLPKNTGDLVKNILVLVVYNPHWNVKWITPSGTLVTDWLRTPDPKDQLVSTSPTLSIRCRVDIFTKRIWSKLKVIVLVLVVVVVLMGVVRLHIHKRKREEGRKFIMVDKILSVLRRHYETMKRKKNLIPYLAIIHVRDMLISPSERNYKLATWEVACDWIAKRESRVRVERQRIAGEDFDVWKWIQEDPPQTEDTLFVDEARKAGPSSVTTASARKKNWYNGTTFDDDAGRNTGRNSWINSPYGSPSPCIRLKNMFEAVKHMKEELCKEIEDSVLDRCIPHGGVVHIYVDRRSPFGCVYLKMSSVEYSLKAYKALHGGWYKGKLVTAKYIPLDKYHKWFQAAISAKNHLYPSS